MMNRTLLAAGCMAALAALTACEHPGAPAPRLAPSPAANTATAAVALPVPAGDVQRAAAGLAARVDGWTLPQPTGAAPRATGTDAAALAAGSSPDDLAAATAALNAFLANAAAPASQRPPE